MQIVRVAQALLPEAARRGVQQAIGGANIWRQREALKVGAGSRCWPWVLAVSGWQWVLVGPPSWTGGLHARWVCSWVLAACNTCMQCFFVFFLHGLTSGLWSVTAPSPDAPGPRGQYPAAAGSAICTKGGRLLENLRYACCACCADAEALHGGGHPGAPGGAQPGRLPDDSQVRGACMQGSQPASEPVR